jgi:hypothetical protein
MTPRTRRHSTDNGELAAAAEVTLDRLGVSDGDAFLVPYNPELVEIAAELVEAARTRTPNVCSEGFAPTSRDGEEPPTAVATAMRQASAIAIVTRYSLSHTPARMAATENGARIASMPHINLDVFARTIPTDYTHLERVGRSLTHKLTHADICRVTAPGGTDVELSLHGREAICDDGDLLARGAWGTCRPARHSLPRSKVKRTGRSSSTDRSPAGGSSTRRFGSSSITDTFLRRQGVPRPGGCSRRSMPAAATGGRSPSSESARTRARQSPVRSSKTRRRKGRFTSPSGPTPASAAPTRRPCTSTASYATRGSSSTGVQSCATGVCSHHRTTTGSLRRSLPGRDRRRGDLRHHGPCPRCVRAARRHGLRGPGARCTPPHCAVGEACRGRARPRPRLRAPPSADTRRRPTGCARSNLRLNGTDRIGMVGLSVGGHLAYLAASEFELAAAAIAASRSIGRTKRRRSSTSAEESRHADRRRP